MIAAALLLAGQAYAGRYAAEWREVARNCEMPGAMLERAKGRRGVLILFVSPRVRRTDGKIACVTQWAQERRLRIVEPPFAQAFALAGAGCGMPRIVSAIRPREIRIGFPQRNWMERQAEDSGALGCLRDWTADRGYRLTVVSAQAVND